MIFDLIPHYVAEWTAAARGYGVDLDGLNLLPNQVRLLTRCMELGQVRRDGGDFIAWLRCWPDELDAFEWDSLDGMMALPNRSLSEGSVIVIVSALSAGNKWATKAILALRHLPGVEWMAGLDADGTWRCRRCDGGRHG